MEEIRTIGIGIIGSVFAASVLSMLYPDGAGKKLYSAVTGVYLIISFVSPFIDFTTDDFEVDFSESALTDYEQYGEELTIKYFEENIKSIIKSKSGIEEDKIYIELNITEEKEVEIVKIEVETDSYKGLDELSETLGTEIEVKR